MSATKNPWMKFYPGDWRSDPALRIVSLAARGLWMEMLCIMHESDRYGHLIVNGIALNDAQIAALAGTDMNTASDLLSELENAGVFSRNGQGCIYSRRMVSDDKKAKTAKKNGKTGGNPSLCKQRKKETSVKGGDKPQDKGGDKAQKPEARINPLSPPSGETAEKHLCPSDYTPSPHMVTWAKGQGFTDQDINTHTIRFRNYWTEKKAKRQGWDKSWQSWVAKEKPSPTSPSFSTGRRASLDELKKRYGKGQS